MGHRLDAHGEEKLEKIVIVSQGTEVNKGLITLVNHFFPECEIQVRIATGDENKGRCENPRKRSMQK